MYNAQRRYCLPCSAHYPYISEAAINPLDQELLHEVRQGNLTSVADLLNRGANTEARTNDSFQSTPLLIATEKGDFPMTELLLDRGADPNALDLKRNNALLWATEKGNSDIVRLLLQKGAIVDLIGFRAFQNDNGYTPLMRAAKNGALEIVQLLLDHGADIHAKGSDLETALTLAAYNGRLDTVQYLLDHGANIDDWNNHRYTSLTLATINQHGDIVRLLLERGADPNKTGVYGINPLTAAIDTNRSDILQLLFDYGAKIDKNPYRSFLSDAVTMGSAPIVHVLLQHGLSADNTAALMTASQMGRADIVRLLLQYGADPDKKNIYGKTALDVARNDEIREILNTWPRRSSVTHTPCWR